jgi:hypothetical protein
MLEEMEAVRVLAESKSVRVLAGKEGVGRNKRCWEKRLVLRVYKDVRVLAEKQGVTTRRTMSTTQLLVITRATSAPWVR